MTRDEYTKMKGERDCLKEELIAVAEVGVELGHFRQKFEKLLTLTRVLDRAAAEYAQHKDDDGDIDGRHYDFCYQSDP